MCHINSVPSIADRMKKIHSVGDISRQIRAAREFHSRLLVQLESLEVPNNIKDCKDKIAIASCVVDYLVTNGDALAADLSTNSLESVFLKLATQEPACTTSSTL